MTARDVRVSRAFNEGSDAQLQGQPQTANPYSFLDDTLMWSYWNQGWLHNDLHFAEEWKRPQDGDVIRVRIAN